MGKAKQILEEWIGLGLEIDGVNVCRYLVPSLSDEGLLLYPMKSGDIRKKVCRKLIANE
jgi:hypothetical protein